MRVLSDEFERSYRVLHRQALAKVGSPEIADDIVQEAFVNTAQATADGRARIRNMGAWLNRCVHNLSMSHLRGRSLLPLDAEIETAAPDSPTEVAHARACCARMYQAVEQLTPTQREAFLLADIRGLPYEEVATNLGRSVDAIRHLLLRARKHVRDAIGPDAVAAAAPLLRLDAVARTPGGGASGLRGHLATRLADLQGAAWSHLQRVTEHVWQPATVALASGALVLGALGLPRLAENRHVAASPPGMRAGLGTRSESGTPSAHRGTAIARAPRPRSGDRPNRATGSPSADRDRASTEQQAGADPAPGYVGPGVSAQARETDAPGEDPPGSTNTDAAATTGGADASGPPGGCGSGLAAGSSDVCPAPGVPGDSAEKAIDVDERTPDVGNPLAGLRTRREVQEAAGSEQRLDEAAPRQAPAGASEPALEPTPAVTDRVRAPTSVSSR